MATKSVYKQVRIKDKSLTQRLVVALENSQYKTAKQVEYSKTVREIKDPDVIRSIFKE